MFSEFDKVWVQAQDFKRESNLVDYALTRRLHLRPQFEIARGVIESVSVLVMNVLAFMQRPAEQLRHDRAVLKFFFASAQVQSPVTGRVDVSVWIDRSPLAAFVRALSRTKFLCPNVTRVPTIFGSAKVALFDFPTKLALKCRCWFVTHVAQFIQLMTYGKSFCGYGQAAVIGG